MDTYRILSKICQWNKNFEKWSTTSKVMHRVSEKNVPVSVKYEPISMKSGVGMSLNTHLIKLCIKCPLHLKYVPALPWETSWKIELLTYILMNHRTATTTTGSYCLKNRRTCSKWYHLYTICSKCPPPVRTKILGIDELKWRIENERVDLNDTVIECDVGDVAPASIRASVRAGQEHFEHIT